jgi:hypothetical protein
MCAEKAPKPRGVRRVLAALGAVVEWDRASALLRSADLAVVTGNYPSEWAPEELHDALGRAGAAKAPFVLLVDTLASPLGDRADVVLPGATWAEKAGTFESAKGRLQAFDRAIDPIDFCKSEAQIALDLAAAGTGAAPAVYNAALTRQRMAAESGLDAFVRDVHLPAARGRALPDVALVEL